MVQVSHLKEYENHTAIYTAFQEKFDGLFSTLCTMIYVSLTLQGTETLTHFHDGTLVELWANLMFMVYFGISMIVVLNILIAMMNSSYQVRIMIVDTFKNRQITSEYDTKMPDI